MEGTRSSVGDRSSVDERAIRTFLTRSRALTDAASPSTRAETRSLLVEPLLEALGWDVRADETDVDVVVDGTRLEYVCSIGETPALFVAIESYDESLDLDRASALERLAGRTGVDRAIYTNGRTVTLFAGVDDVERRSFDLSALAGHGTDLERYVRANAARRIETTTRDAVARRLAVARSDLTASIATDLASVVGAAHEAELQAAAALFLERLVAAFAPDESDDCATSAFADDPDADGPTADASPDDDERRERAASDADDEASGGEDYPSPPSVVEDEDEDEGEYVIRFFVERGSIGAVGHATSEDALVYAAEICLERGLSGIGLPWTPEDGDRVVLDDDGSSMEAPRRLSNGYCLETDGTVDERVTRVERLVSRAGLRAMLTGDWSGGVR